MVGMEMGKADNINGLEGEISAFKSYLGSFSAIEKHTMPIVPYKSR